ncbi:MAG: Fe2+-dependent dioxygenase [Gammaproteobacteria bacterium]|nr:Fe2+-dependent dioxygenase [Gammaproteobacteria bacterium]
MILIADDLMTEDELRFLRGLYAELPVQQGADTAEGDLKQVKNNRQLLPGGRGKEIRARIMEALNRKEYLSFALQPKVVSAPLLNVYGPGETYGDHTDAHLGWSNDRFFRCDISCTIFLDDPDSYDGGELCIRSDHGDARFKLAAGSAIFYPTYFVHRVQPVTRGERRACILWMESLVRDAQKRWLLFELQKVRSWIEEREPVASLPRQSLVNVCENLHRMWVDP